MTTIRVKMTDATGVWFASTLLPTGRTPERHIEVLNMTAQSRNICTKYEHATEEEYWAYRNELRKNLNRG